MAPFVRAHTSSYSSSIVTMDISCIVSEIISPSTLQPLEINGCEYFRYLKNCLKSFSQTSQSHITVNARCAATARVQKVKGQGQKSHEAIWRPGLAEASFSSRLGSNSFASSLILRLVSCQRAGCTFVTGKSQVNHSLKINHK